MRRTAAWLLPAAALVSGMAYAVPLYFSGQTTGLDWDYFNALSLVIRSCVLFYHRFPLHDPWVAGGVDLLVNPQTRLFSPLVALHVFLIPHLANLASLVFYAFVGMIGSYFAFTALGRSPVVAFTTALLYSCGSFFALHFTEGHIPFGTLQLLPLVLFCVVQPSRRRLFWLSLLLAYFLLDGGIYAFVFSLYLFGTVVLVNLAGARATWLRILRHDSRFVLGCLLLIALLGAPKLIPVLVGLRNRVPWLDYQPVSLKVLARAFFSPFQDNLSASMANSPFRFHEYGCYVGLPALLAVAFALCFRGFFADCFKALAASLLWLWIGGGWGPLNPWLLLQRIPLLNNAHVHTRTWLLSFLFFLLVLGQALDFLRERFPRQRLFLLCFCMVLAAQTMFIHNYAFQFAYLRSPAPPIRELIQSTRLDRTVPNGDKPRHYLRPNLGSQATYEPAPPATRVKAYGQPGYRGEAYFVDGHGILSLDSFTPGRIELVYAGGERPEIEINTNHLHGWRVTYGGGEVVSREGELLRFRAPASSGNAVLEYRPRYLPWLLAAFLFGCALLVFLARRLRDPVLPAREAPRFDYNAIPDGFYHDIAVSGRGIRSQWHRQKFQRAVEALPAREGQSILDIGCFSGTFLWLLDEKRFSRQVGVDILPRQIEYANRRLGTPFRRFVHLEDPANLASLNETFDCVTLIEVIEHLTPEQIRRLLSAAAGVLKPGGTLFISTPNYASAWPLLEFLINHLSDMSYEEQHITKFTYWDFETRLARIDPSFEEEFRLELKTTSHFLAPFLAVFSERLAQLVARRHAPAKWRNPFGNLVLVTFRKRDAK